MNFDFAVIGNAGVDTCIFSNGNDFNLEVESNFTEDIDYVGQAGGFTSRGFAQLGYNTAFIGYIGNDHNGKLILDEFSKDGINTNCIFVDPAGTARSINLMYKDGRRKNFYDGKNHMSLDPDLDRCKQILMHSKVAHFHIPNWARKLLPLAKELKVKISCDLQDITSIEDPYRNDFINYANVIFFSSVNFKNPLPIIEQFLSKNNNLIIVCGMGAKGCIVGTKKSITHFNPVSLDKPIIDTNGAGDGLAVGFLSSYFIDNYNLEESILRGQITARYTCTKKANSSSLINKNQLNSYFNKIKNSLYST